MPTENVSNRKKKAYPTLQGSECQFTRSYEHQDLRDYKG